MLSYSNEVVKALDFYSVDIFLDLLTEMNTYQYAVMFIGLIFDILIILFVIISMLLIYSLLLISVETRTFEIGVQRLIGLSSHGFIGLIFTQAFMFVLPAVVFGFLSSMPLMALAYKFLFTEELGFKS